MSVQLDRHCSCNIQILSFTASEAAARAGSYGGAEAFEAAMLRLLISRKEFSSGCEEEALLSIVSPGHSCNVVGFFNV